jgi:hypothetical protein
MANELAVWRIMPGGLFELFEFSWYNQFIKLKTAALRETAGGVSDKQKGDCHYE